MDLPSGNTQASPPQAAATAQRWSAAAIAYTLLLAVFTKLTRVLLLVQSTRNSRPWVVLPMVLGQDVLLVALSGLAGYGLAKLPWPRGARGLRVRLYAGIALLCLLVFAHVFDIGAQELTGSPLTYQRLCGEEGGTVGDLGLIATRDLVLGFGTIVVLCALIWPVLRFAPRARFWLRLAQPRILLCVLAASLLVSYAQARLLRRTLGLETQSMVTLCTSAFDKDSYEARALTKAEWDCLFRPNVKPKVPEHPPVHLPSTRPKNVVVFLAEGVPFEHTGFSGQDQPDPTPRISARVQRDGMVFSRYYAHWHASNQAIFSVACSSLPPLTGDMMRLKPRIDCGEFSQVMQEHGLHAGLFHGGHFSFYNKLALLGRRGFEVELDAEELMLREPKWQRTQWGTDDRAMVEATLKWVDSLGKGERFAALLISIAPHYPFELPRDWKARPFKGGGELPRYLNGVYYIDSVFDQLIRGFEARGLADDTLFVFLGDHGIQVAEPARVTGGRRSFYEPSLHVPMVMINPRLFPRTLSPAQRRSDRVGGHLDLLPTIMDALGEEPDPRHHGQSLFRDELWPRRLFFSAMGGHYIGFVENDHKFVYQPRAKQTEYYDLQNDPNELHDLSDKFPDRMDEYSKDVMKMARGLRAQIDAAPVLHESITMAQVYQRFRKNVAVTMDRAGVLTKCPANAKGDDRVCPEWGALFTQKDGNVMGEPRRCLWVRIPENATLRLRVTDPTTLSLLTSTVATANQKDPATTMYRIDTDVDGKTKSSVTVRTGRAEYVDHARGQKYVEYAISRAHTGLPEAICLQFTKMEK